MKVHKHLQQDVNLLPTGPGVYFFYGESENQAPLYIGKSRSIKKRVQSHFYQVKQQQRKIKLMSQVKRIAYQKTAGELGALLLEASLVKHHLPLYNKQLRRARHVYFYQLLTSADCWTVKLQRADVAAFHTADQCFGLFCSQRQAINFLHDLSKKNQLCQQALKLASRSGPCFNYQLQQCRGVCFGKESHQAYNYRLLQALAEAKQVAWPYPGVIGVIEHDMHTGLRQIHYIDQWRYLMSQSLKKNQTPVMPDYFDAVQFDKDHYRILQQFLLRSKKSLEIIYF